jgi:hypothetical protein
VRGRRNREEKERERKRKRDKKKKKDLTRSAQRTAEDAEETKTAEGT